MPVALISYSVTFALFRFVCFCFCFFYFILFLVFVFCFFFIFIARDDATHFTGGELGI